jgi:Beta-lactamase
VTSPPRLTASYQVLPGHRGYPAVSRLLLGQLAEGFPPAAAVRVCTPDGSPYSAAGGWARLADPGFPEPVPADADTLFDLASLTKVVTTLPLVLLLHQRGQWSIDDPVARWLPGAPRSPVTISQCLLHVSGLVPDRPYYATCAGPAEIRRAVIAELADAVPGQVSYSDLGFMLLGWAVEECAGEPLADLADREVLGPLGMTSTGYRPRAPLERIAATEADGDQRPGTGVVWGQVHDGNAFALGGISGHAGLFGTAGDLGRFAASGLAVVLLSNAVHPVRRLDQVGAFRARIHRAILGLAVWPGDRGLHVVEDSLKFQVVTRLDPLTPERLIPACRVTFDGVAQYRRACRGLHLEPVLNPQFIRPDHPERAQGTRAIEFFP